MDTEGLIRALKKSALPCSGTRAEFAPLVDLCARARVVLIGEATHGTHEFYRLRAELTKLLIAEHGFSAVAAEADWPDAYRVNRYVRGLGADRDAAQALADFRRFPAWMWRNRDVVEFVSWLRDYNDGQTPDRKAGFYGLDLYSLHGSMAAVLEYLAKTDSAAAARARDRYACFEDFGDEPEAYARATSYGLSEDCEREVVSQLIELQRQRESMLKRDGLAAEDEFFQAEQNARVVKVAEQYYRSMFGSSVRSWNLRDTHMADTLDALLDHLGKRFERPKIVVWAHNSHVGDARATDLALVGELNIGQLARERHPNQAVSIGFSTYSGSVTAASDWGAAPERMRVRDGIPESYESIFHRIAPSFLLRMADLDDPPLRAELAVPRLHRAIGVVYKSRTERRSHYYHARLPELYDAVIHVDRTRALEPLDSAQEWERTEAPETYPTGM